MIKIIAKNIVLPHEKEGFIALAKELIEKSRQEEGNISYGLYQNLHDSNLLTFIEEWEDQAAIDRHNQSEHFTRIVPQLGKLTVAGSTVDCYTEID